MNLPKRKAFILLEASKTAHCPAWNHLLVMAKSGVIGDVIDVKASLSKLMDEAGQKRIRSVSGGVCYRTCSTSINGSY